MFLLFCVLLYTAADTTAVEDNCWNNGLSGKPAKMCVSPPQPKNGRYTMNPAGATGAQFFFIQLNATCDEDYHLIGTSILACFFGNWTDQLPECVPQCREEKDSLIVSCGKGANKCLLSPPAHIDTTESSISYDYESTTYFNQPRKRPHCTDGMASCVLPPRPDNGTYIPSPWAEPGDELDFFQANVTCDWDHELVGPKTVACVFGTWSDQMPHCVPYCGDESEQGVVTCLPDVERCVRKKFYNNFDNECGLYNNKKSVPYSIITPWTAGLYSGGYLFVGTGTLISKRVVITAASKFGVLQSHIPREQYDLAVGELKVRYYELRDNYSQRSRVKEIINHPQYTGESTDHRHDLALVVAASDFYFNDMVRPVCLSFNPVFNEDLLQKTIRQETKLLSWDNCFEHKWPQYISPGECRNREPKADLNLLEYDICAEAPTECYAGSGAGMMIQADVGGTTRYILRGVASNIPGVNVNLSVFTDIVKYGDFIKPVLKL